MRLSVLIRLSALVLTVLLNLVTMTRAANRKARKCLQPVQSGQCFGYVPSFAYNPLQRKCEVFIYGGCGGNDNRYDSKTECEKVCRDI